MEQPRPRVPGDLHKGREELRPQTARSHQAGLTSKKKMTLMRHGATFRHLLAIEKAQVKQLCRVGFKCPLGGTNDWDDSESFNDVVGGAGSIEDVRQWYIGSARRKIQEFWHHLSSMDDDVFAFTTGLVRPRGFDSRLAIQCLTLSVVDYANFVILARDSEQRRFKEVKVQKRPLPGPSPLRQVHAVASFTPERPRACDNLDQVSNRKRKAHETDQSPPKKRARAQALRPLRPLRCRHREFGSFRRSPAAPTCPRAGSSAFTLPL